jgi:hypothetical protein
MKFVITEEQNTRLQILRRLDEIWGIIRNSYPFVYPCDYHGLGHFAIALKAEFSYIDSEGFFRENANEIWDVVSKIFANKIKERYDESNCDGEESVIEESNNSQKERLQVLRRVNDEDWSWIREIVDEGTDIYNPCDYGNGEDYLNSVSLSSAQTYLLSYFVNGRSESFLKLTNYIKSLIIKRMGDDIIEYYTYKREDDECK